MASGLLSLALHQVLTVPLILRAEVFETHAAHHDHHAASAPVPGARLLANAVSEILTAIAFALLLVAIWQWRQEIPGWRQGVVWGIAGFLTLLVAPSLGLPPELPGTVSAALPARQAWWIATVALSAIGLGLLAWQRSWLWRGLGLILLALPHALGAPAPAEVASTAPPALQQAFEHAVYISGFLFWVVLGALASLAYARTART